MQELEEYMDQRLMMNQLHDVKFKWKRTASKKNNFKNIKMKNGKNWKLFNCPIERMH